MLGRDLIVGDLRSALEALDPGGRMPIIVRAGGKEFALRAVRVEGVTEWDPNMETGRRGGEHLVFVVED